MSRKIKDITALFIDNEVETILHSLVNFTPENIKWYVADSNSKATTMLQERHYDVVVYDVGLDEATNYPFSQFIREQKPGAFLVATSFDMDAYRFTGCALPACFDAKVDTFDLTFGGELTELLKKNGFTIKPAKEAPKHE